MSKHIKTSLSPTGAIFCGGKSSRMGIPKAGVRLASGLTMIEHVYRALNQVCSKIVFVGHAEGVPSELLDQGLHIFDEIPHLGPLGALNALLSSKIADNYIISPCDLLNVKPELYNLLASSFYLPLSVLKFQGKIEPLIGRYGVELLPQLRLQLNQDDLSLRALLAKTKTNYIEVPRHLNFAMDNANSFKDLILN